MAESDAKRPSDTLSCKLQRLGGPNWDIGWPFDTAGVKRDLRKLVYAQLMAHGNHFFPASLLEKRGIDLDQAFSQQQGLVEDEYAESARGRPCGHMFSADETVYRCRDCGVDSTCVMCTRCYRASDHEGHDVIISINGGHGGCCDCGDVEAWKADMRCAIHHSDIKPEQSNPPIDPALLAHLREIIVAILDFVLNVFEHAKESVSPPTEISVLEDTRLSALTGEEYAQEGVQDTFSTVLWNDEKHSFEEVIDLVKRSCKKTRSFGKEVADTVDKYGRAVVYSGHLSEAVRIAGALGRIRLGVSVRATRDVFREQVSHLLIELLLDLASLNVLVGDERNSQVFRELICEELLKDWKVGVARSTQIGSTEQPLEDEPTDNDDADEDDDEQDVGMEDIGTNNILHTIALLDPDVRAEILTTINVAETRHREGLSEGGEEEEEEDEDEEPEAAPIPFCPAHWRNHQSAGRIQKSRLAKLFLVDLRLWKSARLAVRELYVSTMISIPEFKRKMGITFATIYKTLAEIYLFADRDPDSSMIIFSVQLFTVPSISECLVKEHQFFTTLLAALYTYFTKRKIGFANEVDTQSIIASEVYSFRSRRHYHLINDLRYLLQTKGIQKIIPSLKDVQHQFIDFMALFQGMNPQRQIVGEHVEYEPETWINAFNVMMQVAKHAQLFAKTFEFATDDQVLYILKALHQRLIHWAFAGTVDRMPRFEPAARGNSFHHPLHWLFAGLLAQYKGSYMVEASHRAATDECIRYILRTIHWTWEIRAGLWVRNGHSLRAQLHHYTEVSFREYCLDRDIQCIQWWFASAPEVGDPFARSQRHEYRVHKMLDGFGSICRAGQLPKDDTELQMQELMAHFLIVLFAERAWLLEQDPQEELARTLRHALVFGPGTYSEISKLLHDADDDDQSIETVLHQIADFRPPSGLEDTGKFTLKDAELKKIDPYFHRYSRQQIDEVRELLANKDLADQVVQLGMPRAPWWGLPDFALTKTLQSYIKEYFVSLAKAPATKLATLEGITDKYLQLTILMLHEDLLQQNEFLPARIFEEDWSIFHHLTESRLHLNPLFKGHHGKLFIINDLLGDVSDSSSGSDPGDPPLESMSSEEDEFAKKKALAKARQQKLLQDMQASQKAFMTLNEMEEDEELEQKEVDDAWHFPKGNCLVCQQELSSSMTYGLLACIHESRLDRPAPKAGGTAGSSFHRPLKVDEDLNWVPVSEHQETRGEDIITTCGHLMHWECYSAFFENVEQRHQRYYQLGRNVTDTVEFKCPLCQTIGNLFLPLLADSRDVIHALPKEPMQDWSIDYAWAGDQLAKNVTISLLKERYKLRKFTGESNDSEPDSIARTPDNLADPGSYTQVLQMMEEHCTLKWKPHMVKDNQVSNFSRQLRILTATMVDFEIALRGRSHNDNKDTPVATLIEGLSDNNILSLRAQCSMMEKFLALGYYYLTAKSHSAKGDKYAGNPQARLGQLRESVFPTKRAGDRESVVGEPVLSQDIFSLLTEVTFLFRKRDFSFKDVLEVFLAIEMVKAYYFHSGHKVDLPERLQPILEAYALVFLRKASILANTVLGLEFPKEPADELTELQYLARILGLAEPIDVFAATHNPLAAHWVRHFEQCSMPHPPKYVLSHPLPFTMAPLPQSLDAMLEYCQKVVCPRCKTTPSQPALCMLCGDFVCFQSHCCWDEHALAGECNTHREKCGGSIGIYLIPKRCAMLFLRNDLGSFGAAPYLDVHGETDPDMKRGKPQYLNERRYEMGVVQLHLQHQIPTWLAKKLDMTSGDMGIGGWNTL